MIRGILNLRSAHAWLIKRPHVRASRLALAVFVVSFIVLAALYVPRLVNCIWSDVEFTGWVSPIAHRIASGESIYRDFTLPIPPASFLLLAGAQTLLHRYLLLDELWMCAIANLAMALVAYGTARAFTTPMNAVLVAIATAPIVILTPKEIAYDQTAQLVAWCSVALLARALTRPDPRLRRRWLVAAGLVATLTLAFKSSTGIGALAGSLLAMLAVTGVALRRGGLVAMRSTARDWIAMLSGLAAGCVATALIVLAAGGSLGEFYQVVFVDGPALKGGRGRMVLNLLSYVSFQAPVHISLVVIVITAWILMRALAGAQPLLLPDADPNDLAHDRERDAWIQAAIISVLTIAVTGIAVALLAANRPAVPFVFHALAGFGMVPGMLGMMLLAIFLVSSLRAASDPFDRKSAFAAVALLAGSVSLLHNLSHPSHRPFYDNNPIIPLSLLTLWVLLDQARLQRFKLAVFALSLLCLFGDKFQRYLDARYAVTETSFWSGLRVSDNGLTVLTAAQRARELAGADGTVMMLPEDPMVEALIGRPRPRLQGGVVFVDQFPDHVLQHDLAELRANPPQVLVLHPNDMKWNRVYATWSLKSAAARVQTEFVEQVRGTLYDSDSTYSLWFFHGPCTMEVLVRKAASE